MQRGQPTLDYGTRPSRFRLTRRQVRATFCALASIPVFLFVLIDIGCGLEHQSILWPWIDTVQAAGYSEDDFQTISVGMTRQQVDALMCKPLTVVTLSPDGRSYAPVPAGASLDLGAVRYSYTGDGRCPWGDFAWFGREVWFKDGVVTEVFSDVYND
jgi:hypothetical protein